MARPWIDPEEWGPEDLDGDPRAPAPTPSPAAPLQDTLRVVVWMPIRCPYCRSQDCPVTSSGPAVLPRTRYHTCRACGQAFKSIEAAPPK